LKVEVDSARVESAELFWKARRQATREIFWGSLRRQTTECVSFEAVRVALGLAYRRVEGIRTVPLDSIVGSVDRYDDFTRRFHPCRDDMKDRWVRVASAMYTIGLGPIRLYRIGDAYFVSDGNHRTSISRALQTRSIEAEIWRFPCRLNLKPDLTSRQLPCKAAYLEFLHRTNLDQVRPDHDVELTDGTRYAVLEEHVAGHAKWLESRSGGAKVPLGEAVGSWYDRVFLPMLAIICDLGICQEFPALTTADLYVLLLEHRKHLSLNWNRPVSLQEAVDDYVGAHGRRPTTRLKRWFRILRSPLDHLRDRREVSQDAP
jgi:hypothetical protein